MRATEHRAEQPPSGVGDLLRARGEPARSDEVLIACNVLGPMTELERTRSERIATGWTWEPRTFLLPSFPGEPRTDATHGGATPGRDLARIEPCPTRTARDAQPQGVRAAPPARGLDARAADSPRPASPRSAPPCSRGAAQRTTQRRLEGHEPSPIWTPAHPGNWTTPLKCGAWPGLTGMGMATSTLRSPPRRQRRR